MVWVKENKRRDAKEEGIVEVAEVARSDRKKG